MLWDKLSEAWKISFEGAWESYCKGSMPVGAVITDNKGNIIIKGRGRHNEKSAPAGEIHNNKVAHAEMNALTKLNNDIHKNISEYTLYTTLEPCPMCFGALYMSGIRNLCFAAYDDFAGSLRLYGSTEYLGRKDISIIEYKELANASIAIKSTLLFKNQKEKYRKVIDELLERLKKRYPKAVELGYNWFENGFLDTLIDDKVALEKIFFEVDKKTT